jgi:hypothetical protein
MKKTPARAGEGSERMKEMMRKWAALVVVLITMLAANLAFGEDPGACYGAYLESGLTEQQMTFDEFRHFYSDTLCATGGDGLAAMHADRVSGATR